MTELAIVKWLLGHKTLLAYLLVAVVMASMAFMIHSKNNTITSLNQTIGAQTQQLKDKDTKIAEQQKLMDLQNDSIDNYKKQSDNYASAIAQLPQQLADISSKFTTGVTKILISKPIPSDCEGAMQWLRDHAKDASAISAASTQVGGNIGGKAK